MSYKHEHVNAPQFTNQIFSDVIHIPLGYIRYTIYNINSCKVIHRVTNVNIYHQRKIFRRTFAYKEHQH